MLVSSYLICQRCKLYVCHIKVYCLDVRLRQWYYIPVLQWASIGVLIFRGAYLSNIRLREVIFVLQLGNSEVLQLM